MTADVLHNCLTHGLIKMKDINLICFDEAHHAKKNHVYARYNRLLDLWYFWKANPGQNYA